MRVRLSPRAERDLEEIGDYIATHNPRRAAIYVRRLRQRAVAIGPLAKGFPVLEISPPGMRRALYGSYVLYFSIEGENVRIERILHGARDHSALLDEN